MPKYRLNYGSVREFEAQTPGEVVPFIADSHFAGGEDERDFMRRLAISMSQWNRGSYCYTSRDKLAESMMKEGAQLSFSLSAVVFISHRQSQWAMPLQLS